MITTEREHHLAVAPRWDQRRCACGDWIVAPFGVHPEMLARIIRAHSKLERHRSWRHWWLGE